jgi:hypothetical protein
MAFRSLPGPVHLKPRSLSDIYFSKVILRANRVDGVSLYSTTQEGLHVGIAKMIGSEMMGSPTGRHFSWK